MDRSRVIILGFAGVAALVAALLVRGLFGGGTQHSVAAVAPKPVATEQVLVAAQDIAPGSKLTADAVKWQVWPKAAVSPAFITAGAHADIAKIVAGTVARAPLVTGEPLSTSKVVHADSAGFMSAQLQPGMRAISIGISDNTSAGGFILPNDHVDVLLTAPTGSAHVMITKTILSDVRVLAIGQAFEQKKNEKVATGKTATLELTPGQTELIARAAATGTLSLSLRPLGDSSVASKDVSADRGVAVIRYGVTRGTAATQGD